MMEAIKLTVPQRTLLKKICERPMLAVEYYPPAVVLVRLGLAMWQDNHLAPTESGRKIVRTEAKATKSMEGE